VVGMRVNSCVGLCIICNQLEYKERSVRAVQLRCQVINPPGGEPIKWGSLGEAGETHIGWPAERLLVVSGHYSFHDLARVTAFACSWEVSYLLFHFNVSMCLSLLSIVLYTTTSHTKFQRRSLVT